MDKNLIIKVLSEVRDNCIDRNECEGCMFAIKKHNSHFCTIGRPWSDWSFVKSSDVFSGLTIEKTVKRSEDLINNVLEITSYCSDHETCNHCAFNGNDNECVFFRNLPSDWIDILNNQKEVKNNE